MVSIAKTIKLSIFILCLGTCQSANILFFFRFSTYSHRITAWPLVEALVEKGHSISFLQSNENRMKPNPKVTEVPVKVKVELPDFIAIRNQYGPWGQAFIHAFALPSITANACNEVLEDPDIINWINSSKFDLVFVNAFYNDCAYGLAFKWKAKTIVFGTTTVNELWYDAFGLPTESSWISNTQLAIRQDLPLSFFNRILPTLAQLYYRYSATRIYHPLVEPNLREKLNMPDMPPLVDLELEVSLLLMNSHFSEELARSLPPLVVPVAGMHCKEKSLLPPLPEEMEKFVNESGTHGFVYVSFGSGARIEEASDEVLTAFFNAFRNSKTRFLWKWDKPRPEGMPSNILTAKWMPQQSILAHPKVRGFITHGGLMSMQEAIFYGVPMISFPVFTEQDYNAERLHRTKRGIRLEITSVTQEDIEDALDKILNDETYQKSIKKASVLFKDRPMKPVETALWWVEYVLRHNDTSVLRPLSMYQTWYEKRLLDVWAFILFFVVLVSLLIVFVIKKILLCLFKLVGGTKKESRKIKKN